MYGFKGWNILNDNTASSNSDHQQQQEQEHQQHQQQHQQQHHHHQQQQHPANNYHQQDTNNNQYQQQNITNQIPEPNDNTGISYSNDEALLVLQHRIQEMQGNNIFDELNLMAQAGAAVAQTQQTPTEQFLTVANNGTILGATNTVTGFPPDSLLMTSV
jgi:Fe2+ transport system protein B